jgi:ABC-2 type transport system ATP-binding protein
MGTPQVDDATRRVTVGVAGRDSLPAAMRALESAGVEVDDIALRQPTLDEVFLALTGRHPDTDDEARQKHAA